MKITRDVVSDLWPVYVSGAASADTRTLVETFLADDPELARMLKESAGKKARRFPYLLNLAVLFSCFAFARIISDTSWDVSPRRFIVTAAVAGVLWIAYCASLWWRRRKVMS